MTDESLDDEGYCCSMMTGQHRQECDVHESRWDCPDNVVVRLDDGTIGLPVRDGENRSASSVVEIWHCPWCGSPLPGHQPHPTPDADVALGKALTDDEVDARVDAWHNGAGGTTELHEYLGWTSAEYGHWAETGELPPDQAGGSA